MSAAKKTAAAIFQPDDIPTSEFKYSNAIPSKNGPITNVYLNHDSGRPKIQTPILTCPFGMSSIDNNKDPKKPSDPSYSIELQLGSESAKVESFTAYLESMDTRVLADGQKNSATWMPTFKGKMSEKMAKKLYKPLVKRYFDKEQLIFTDKYPPRVKFKMNRKNGKFMTRFFDHNRQPIDVNSMTAEELDRFGKGYRMRVIFEFGGIWGGAKGFGVTLRADQIMLYPPQRLTGFGFLKDVEDDLIFGAAPAAEHAAEEDPANQSTEEDEDEASGGTASPEEEEEVASGEASGGSEASPEEEEEASGDAEEAPEAPEEEEQQSEEAPEEEEEEEQPEPSPEPSPEPVKKKATKKKTADADAKQTSLGKYTRKKK